MFGMSGIHGHLVLLLICCGLGNAGLVVYEGNNKIEEFPDTELAYTDAVRSHGIEGFLVAANPLHACINISRPPNLNTTLNWFVLISGNLCRFETKVLNAKLAGYAVAIIYTYRGRVESTGNLYGHYRFYSDMPAVVIKFEDGIKLKDNYLYTTSMLFRLIIFPNSSFSVMTLLVIFSIIAGFFIIIMLIFTVVRFFQQSEPVQNGRLSSQHLRQLQTTKFQKDDHYETCAICLEDYKEQDILRILPCSHGYHTKCIDPWLTNNRCICPVCKRKVVLTGESSNSIGSTFEEEETTPLLQAQRAHPHGNCSYVNPSAANSNASSGHLVTGNTQAISGRVVPIEGGPDRQFVFSFLQL